MTRIAFLGLGGVGGYFGAKMARAFTSSADVEIIFLAREKTANVLRANGLKLITPLEEFIARPHKVATHSDHGLTVDYLLFSVKSYDLEESLKQFCAFIGPHTVIVPLLNGIDAVDRVKKIFPENEVLGGCVYIVSRITGPGVITETGNIHDFHFGGPFVNRARAEELFALLKHAHEEVYLHEDIRPVIWKKFVFISAIASLTSYLDVCIGKILELPANRKMLVELFEEIIRVAQAEKILLPPEIISTTLEKMEKLPYDTTSSMHSDFKNGSRTEIKSLTAEVVKLADQHGISVPAYRKILDGLLLSRD